MRSKLSSATVTDKDTLATIKEVFERYNYLADPHGAVGYLALSQYLADHPADKGIFLETAHPVKFPDAVEKVTGQPIPVPDSLQPIMKRDKLSIFIPSDYAALKEFLLNKS